MTTTIYGLKNCDTCKKALNWLKRFGIEPRVALLSHSSFGSADSPTAEKMRTALTGAFVGKTLNQGGKGVMVDYQYRDGAAFQPPAAEVKKSRAE